jgi:hypothetical protein
MSKIQYCAWLVASGSILLLWLSACMPFGQPAAQPRVGSCLLDLPPSASDEMAIEAILAAEGELVVKQEITTLMGLWNTGSFVSDAKNTPTNPADDQYWLDKDAIRHRYVRTVFPGAPSQVAPRDFTIQIEAERAVVTATTRIGDEISPAGDRWELVKSQGCWLIQSLTYNLEPAQP